MDTILTPTTQGWGDDQISEWHIVGTQYVSVIVILCLGVPGPEGETRDSGNLESGVQSGSTPRFCVT